MVVFARSCAMNCPHCIMMALPLCGIALPEASSRREASRAEGRMRVNDAADGHIIFFLNFVFWRENGNKSKQHLQCRFLMTASTRPPSFYKLAEESASTDFFAVLCQTRKGNTPIIPTYKRREFHSFISFCPVSFLVSPLPWRRSLSFTICRNVRRLP